MATLALPEHSHSTTTTTQPLLVSVKEASAALDVSFVTIYQLAKSGQLRLIKFGLRCTRIPLVDIKRLAETGFAGRLGIDREGGSC